MATGEWTPCECPKAEYHSFGAEARGVCRQTAIYATGVGLGATKGKEVGKYQEGYAGYVNMVKDSVSHV